MKLDDEDNLGEDDMVTINSKEDKGSNGQKLFSYLNDGLSVINEKRKQYVDPYVKQGVKQISEKWNQGEQTKTEGLQRQRVLYEKLKKVSVFLENLKGGSSYEQEHRSIVNIDVDEGKLLDIQSEVDTMIQMTYMRPNYE
jgi:hypothetical protein